MSLGPFPGQASGRQPRAEALSDGAAETALVFRSEGEVVSGRDQTYWCSCIFM